VDFERITTIIANSDPMVWIVLGSILLAILLLGALIGWGLSSWRRRQRFKKRFGPEYERLREETGNRATAEA
jgi:hypothetical protein